MQGMRLLEEEANIFSAQALVYLGKEVHHQAAYGQEGGYAPAAEDAQLL